MEIYDKSKVYQEFNYPKEFLKIVVTKSGDFGFLVLNEQRNRLKKKN